MRIRIGRAAVGLACSSLGLIVGFAAGQRQGFSMGRETLQAEVRGVLSLHVEAASSVRVHDDQRALRLLDSMIDAGAVSLLPEAGDPYVHGALRRVRLYRDLVPPQGRYAAELMQGLATVAPVDLSAVRNPTRDAGLRALALHGEG